jgi:hypothetical protein
MHGLFLLYKIKHSVICELSTSRRDLWDKHWLCKKIFVVYLI